MPITKTADALPPFGLYVLVHVPDRPWSSPNEEGVFWVSARRVVTSPYAQGTPPGYWDYYYQGAGAEVFNGQEVTEWCPLPHREPDERGEVVSYIQREATKYQGAFVGTAAEAIDEIAACIQRGKHLMASEGNGEG